MFSSGCPIISPLNITGDVRATFSAGARAGAAGGVLGDFGQAGRCWCGAGDVRDVETRYTLW